MQYQIFLLSFSFKSTVSCLISYAGPFRSNISCCLVSLIITSSLLYLFKGKAVGELFVENFPEGVAVPETENKGTTTFKGVFLKHSVMFRPKKIYRLKEDQAVSLSLELGRREKVVRHPVCRFPPPNLFPNLFVL